MKKLIQLAFIAILSVMGLAACDGGVSLNDHNQAVANARSAGAAEEASKTDGKLASARDEIDRIAIQNARQGGYSAQANCNVVPVDLAKTKAVKDFPSQVVSIYKERCSAEVAKMNAERKVRTDRAVARAQERGRKIAAARAARERRLAARRQLIKQANARPADRR